MLYILYLFPDSSSGLWQLVLVTTASSWAPCVGALVVGMVALVCGWSGGGIDEVVKLRLSICRAKFTAENFYVLFCLNCYDDIQSSEMKQKLRVKLCN